MITVQHSAKDDRIYFKQGKALSASGYPVSIVHGSSADTLKDMSGLRVKEGPDELGINHWRVAEPKSWFAQQLKKVYRGSFYTDFIAKACSTGAKIFVAHEAQSIYIARKCAERVGGAYVFDSHESLHLVSPKARYAIRTEMRRMPYFTTANQLTQKAILALNPSASSETIYNAAVIPSSAIHPSTDYPLIIHEGSLPFSRGLRLMLEGLAILKQRIPDFKFKIVGSMAAEEQGYFDTMARQHLLYENIEITGWVPYERLAEHISGGEIGLILNIPTPNNLYAGPANKLFNYMACNMAVVAVELPETSKILNTTKAGITLGAREPKLLADTLCDLMVNKDLLNSYRTAAHEAHKTLNWDTEKEKLISFYKNVNSSL
jgi:glycosyltransferase involved in cell wall biosynthesis